MVGTTAGQRIRCRFSGLLSRRRIRQVRTHGTKGRAAVEASFRQKDQRAAR